MYCTKCGIELRDQDRFCFQCGRSTGRGVPKTDGSPRLSRPMQEAKLGGVCAGFARHFGMDVTLVRILWIVLIVWPLPLFGVISYIVAWIVMPKDPVPAPVQEMHPAGGAS
ncbi:MAG TPA: PspC domain-containing protein [Bryobacteraceae bacterium]|nr:PspC domain-containing protein [Bryobacteraceae bacterium]